jgi:hypothetical protein
VSGLSHRARRRRAPPPAPHLRLGLGDLSHQPCQRYRIPPLMPIWQPAEEVCDALFRWLGLGFGHQGDLVVASCSPPGLAGEADRGPSIGRTCDRDCARPNGLEPSCPAPQASAHPISHIPRASHVALFVQAGSVAASCWAEVVKIGVSRSFCP